MDNINKWYECMKSVRFHPTSFSGSYSYCHKAGCDQKLEKEGCFQKYTGSYTSLQILLSRRAFCEGDKTLSSPRATDKMEEAHQKMHRGCNIVSEIEVQNYLSNETGRERLIQMFSTDHKGEMSPEMQLVKNATLQSAAITFLCASFLAGRQARNDFIAKNRATVFKTRFQAYRRLHDTIFLFSMKEGAKWALRISVFSLMFLLTSQTIAVYRNKSSVWEYTAASALTVGLYKANIGLRGLLVATGFGTVIGSLGGVLIYGLMKISNETQEQRHYWQVQRQLESNKAVHGQHASSVVTEAA